MAWYEDYPYVDSISRQAQYHTALDEKLLLMVRALKEKDPMKLKRAWEEYKSVPIPPQLEHDMCHLGKHDSGCFTAIKE